MVLLSMYTDTYGMPIISDISKYFTGCATTPNGTKEYFVAGELVKKVYHMGDTLNYKRGKFHCLDGPAIIRPNNTEWWVEGNFRYRKGVILPDLPYCLFKMETGQQPHQNHILGNG